MLLAACFIVAGISDDEIKARLGTHYQPMRQQYLCNDFQRRARYWLGLDQKFCVDQAGTVYEWMTSIAKRIDDISYPVSDDGYIRPVGCVREPRQQQ